MGRSNSVSEQVYAEDDFFTYLQSNNEAGDVFLLQNLAPVG